MKTSKRYAESAKLVDRNKEYDIKEVIKRCKINIEKKKEELKQQLEFISKQYEL